MSVMYNENVQEGKQLTIYFIPEENPSSVNVCNFGSDLSYSECTACAFSSCYKDDECSLVLGVTDGLGGSVSFRYYVGIGSAAIKTACYILAMMYLEIEPEEGFLENDNTSSQVSSIDDQYFDDIRIQ